MRIADKMAYNQVNQNLAKNRSEMADLQSQAATQKRINKISDDPNAAARVLAARTEESSNKQFIKNINNGKAFLDFSDQSLSELSDVLVRAKELAVGAANDASGNAESRKVTASEIEQIYNQSVQIGNRKMGERYIFGGFKTETKPFSSQGEYNGDDGEIKIQIQKDSFVGMNMPGNKIFLGRGSGGGDRGFVASRYETPTDVNELKVFQAEETERQEKNKDFEDNFLPTRGPASLRRDAKNEDPVSRASGVNIFATLKGLEISLRSNDKEGIQDALDTLDQAISQVVYARSELGARANVISGTLDSLHKAVVDNQGTVSQLEDADLYQVISDINKSDSTLKATLETSSKLIQPSLLDFLK